MDVPFININGSGVSFFSLHFSGIKPVECQSEIMRNRAEQKFNDEKQQQQQKQNRPEARMMKKNCRWIDKNRTQFGLKIVPCSNAIYWPCINAKSIYKEEAIREQLVPSNIEAFYLLIQLKIKCLSTVVSFV